MRLLVPISALLAGLAVGAGSGVPAPTAPSQTSQVAVTATADAYVSASARRRNFGRARALLVRGRPAARAYVRFDLRGLRGPVARARLVVYSVGRSARSVRVRTSSARWSERRITFVKAPRAGGTVGTARAARGQVSIDVTRAVRTGSILSFALSTTGRGGLRLASREAGSTRRPQLVLEQAPETLIAAGDIAGDTPGDEQTAALLDQIPGTVAALGDLAYEDGTAAEFATWYAPTWGRAYARTRPAPGNHEYQTPGAAGYFGYWGPIAGDPAQGWYSYDLGPWHVVSLNSNCSFIGGCGAGSAQEKWLRADLASHQARCTLAYWHHPRFSGGVVGGSSMMQPLWQALYELNADLVLVAHAHNYQRFAPMTAAGVPNANRGLREFVVGTGGRSHHAAGAVTNLELANDTTFGVLKLTLNAAGYDWQFVPVAGASFTDSGSAACH
jgi:acid phosphatase type 7